MVFLISLSRSVTRDLLQINCCKKDNYLVTYTLIEAIILIKYVYRIQNYIEIMIKKYFQDICEELRRCSDGL